jgi:Rieske Fe-S protein
MPDPTPSPPPIGRRALLVGGAAISTAGLVAACGEPPAQGAPGPSVPTGLNPPLPPTGAGTPVGRVSDVPVGGGKVFPGLELVVTQPTAGEFRGFWTECPHAGCQVNAVANGTVDCPCHGSRFHLDGSVARGPAARPLRDRAIALAGDEIRLA